MLLYEYIIWIYYICVLFLMKWKSLLSRTECFESEERNNFYNHLPIGTDYKGPYRKTEQDVIVSR